MFRSNLEGLGLLADPTRPLNAIDPGDFDAATLLSWLRRMLLIRYAEEAIGDLVMGGEARTPCHLGIGQEAIAVGIAACLSPQDRVFGTHRSHGHYLAMGAPVEGLLLEILGKAGGVCHGMGGSMHIYSAEHGFHGSVPIVGATIPLAVGAALAARLDRTGADGAVGGDTGPVGVCFFGDGTSEEGVLHESLNLAAIMGLPVVFVCENNLYSSHLDILQRQPCDRVARYAEAHCVAARTVDGNDVCEVARVAAELIGHARRNLAPVFIEAVTYRWRGHVGARIDEDVGVRRKHDDLQSWMNRDPVARLASVLEAKGALSPAGFDELRASVREEVRRGLEAARAGAYPAGNQVLDLVYADLPTGAAAP